MSKSYIARHAGLEVAFSADKRTYSHAAVAVRDGTLVVIARFGRPDLISDKEYRGRTNVVVVPVEIGELSVASEIAKLGRLADAADQRAKSRDEDADEAEAVLTKHPERLHVDGYIQMYDPAVQRGGWVCRPAEERKRAAAERAKAAKYRKQIAKLEKAAQ